MRATTIAKALDVITCRELGRSPPGGARTKQAESQRRHPAARLPRMRMSADTVASKVPAVTLGFWIIKIAATTLGETGGEAAKARCSSTPSTPRGSRRSIGSPSPADRARRAECEPTARLCDHRRVHRDLPAGDPAAAGQSPGEHRAGTAALSSSTHPFQQNLKRGRRRPLLNSGGEGGIRTHEHPLRCYWNSSPAPSTARPPLQSSTYDSLARTLRG
jgi:hypothetical protein